MRFYADSRRFSTGECLQQGKSLEIIITISFHFFLQFHSGSLRSLRTKRRFLKWDEEEGGGWRVEGEGWKIEDGG